MRRRRGYSLIELLTVLLVLAALTRLAVPRFRDVKRRALAAEILGDIDMLRIAFINYHADTGAYPPDYGPGTVPTELLNYVPKGTDFVRGNYTLDWETWTASGPSGGTVVGIKVDAPDPELVRLASNLVGPAVATYGGASSATFILLGVGKLF
jgi:prepilin-type N-terminal cleavage/methylation domain-containing protein